MLMACSMSQSLVSFFVTHTLLFSICAFQWMKIFPLENLLPCLVCRLFYFLLLFYSFFFLVHACITDAFSLNLLLFRFGSNFVIIRLFGRGGVFWSLFIVGIFCWPLSVGLTFLVADAIAFVFCVIRVIVISTQTCKPNNAIYGLLVFSTKSI